MTATITLYSDAKASQSRYGITDRHGNPVWYGRFFNADHRDFDGAQSSCELAAAKKAAWLAGKVKAALGLDELTLTLFVDAEWLTWANECVPGSDRGGKARALAKAAQMAGVAMTVKWIAGIDNPADAYTICHGFKRWQDNDLASLIERVD